MKKSDDLHERLLYIFHKVDDEDLRSQAMAAIVDMQRERRGHVKDLVVTCLALLLVGSVAAPLITLAILGML